MTDEKPEFDENGKKINYDENGERMGSYFDENGRPVFDMWECFDGRIVYRLADGRWSGKGVKNGKRPHDVYMHLRGN